MSKFWQYNSRDDMLSYYVYAPTNVLAIKVVEDLVGPQNPSRRVLIELEKCPEGYFKDGTDKPQIIAEED